MNHNQKGRKLNRTAEHRKALMRNMATSLFLHGRVETTTMKAKELRRFAEPIITKAKRGDLHARRLVQRDDVRMARQAPGRGGLGKSLSAELALPPSSEGVAFIAQRRASTGSRDRFWHGPSSGTDRAADGLPRTNRRSLRTRGRARPW